jgi:uncharacterized protein (TIGR04255 family)
MPTSSPYPSPPIFDAVIELRFTQSLSSNELDSFAKSLRSFYDQYEEGAEVDVQVLFNDGSVEPKVSEPRPVRSLNSIDQTDRCRLEGNKFSWSRLAPYEGWEPFESRALRDISKLPKKFSFRSMERIGVRYRNRIDVPLNDDHIGAYEEYLAVNLRLPELLDPTIGYAWRIDHVFNDRKINAMVASSVVPPEDKLNDLRSTKNEIFEACVTDLARESFK